MPLEDAMSYARQLLDTYPRSFNVDAGGLAATIDALSDCAQACGACADDCLSEQDVAELVKCIRLCLDCADVCTATLRVASRQTGYDANVMRPLLGPAWPPAGAAGTSASGTPGCTSTAGCARRRAGAASGPAISSWPPSGSWRGRVCRRDRLAQELRRTALGAWLHGAASKLRRRPRGRAMA